MIGGRPALGDDFQPRAAGAREARGVWVVVDFYFLNGGGSDAGSVGLNAVDDERDAVGSGGVVVEEAGHGGDVVLIEDGYAVERVAVDGIGVLVFGTLGAHERRGISGGDSDGFVRNRNLQGEADRGLTFVGYGGLDADVTETLGVKVEGVVAGRNVVEAERTGAVSSDLSEELAVRGKERHLRFGDRRSRGVEERSCNGARGGSLIFSGDCRTEASGTVQTLGREQGRRRRAQNRQQQPQELRPQIKCLPENGCH